MYDRTHVITIGYCCVYGCVRKPQINESDDDELLMMMLAFLHFLGRIVGLLFPKISSVLIKLTWHFFNPTVNFLSDIGHVVRNVIISK